MVSWGYVAGYFDGEGTVINGRKAALAFCNTHRDSLIRIQEFLKAGHIRRMTDTPHRLGRKPIFILRIARNDDLRRILPKLIPHAVVKRTKLTAMWRVVLKRRGITAPHLWWREVDIRAIEKRYRKSDGSVAVLALEYGVSLGAMYKLFLRNGIRRKPWGGPKERVVPLSERVKVSRAKKAFWAIQANRARMSEAMTGVPRKSRQKAG